jgi:hypothetical protein
MSRCDNKGGEKEMIETIVIAGGIAGAIGVWLAVQNPVRSM